MWKHFFGARWVGRPSTALLPWLSNARVANLKGTPQKEPFFFEGQVLVYWCSHRKIPSVFSIASTAQIGLSLNTNLVLHEIITFPNASLGKNSGNPERKTLFIFQVEIMDCMTDSIITIQMKMMDLTSITLDDGQNPSVCLQTLRMAGDSYLPPTEVFRLMLLPHIYLHTIWEFLQILFNRWHPPKITIEWQW